MTPEELAEGDARSWATRARFAPARWLPGGHLQTIVPALLPVRQPLDAGASEVIAVADDAALRVEILAGPEARRGTLVLVHGIGGSARSPYMRRMAARAFSSGWAVARVNCRNCGGTESLSRTLYNAGQSDDLGCVLAQLDRRGLARPFALVGFSLGGAMALRYAGRSGSSCLAETVVAVNPPIDLEACCSALERKANALYHAHFTLSLLRLLRRVRRLRPVPGPDPNYRSVRTLRRLDTFFTAPDAGYRTAEDYYRGASATPYAGGIRVPSLLVFSENDPFVPREIFAALRRRPPSALRFLATQQGGHLGFWNATSPRFWAGEVVMDYLERELVRGAP